MGDHRPPASSTDRTDRTAAAGPDRTRAQWAATADAWLLTARRQAQAGGALILPPGRSSQCGPLSDGIEGFCRSFILAGARLAHGADRLDHAGWYARGLDAAMTREGPGAWGRAVSAGTRTSAGIQQPIVEAANLAFGLALCREQVWDRLAEPTRERLADWLAHHAALRAWDNNWLLFTAVVEAFLASVGVQVPGGHMDEDVARVESWYLGDGWYNDGPVSGSNNGSGGGSVGIGGPAVVGGNIDHYNSWVIHPFLWLWYRLRGDAADPAGRARMLERLGEFAGSYARTFAADGAPLHQGRSLTYRTAVLAGLWTAGLAGVGVGDGDGPISPGQTRRMCGATLGYFERLGVDGTRAPSLGWRDEHFEPSLQVYSGPGSPYFAGMGFLGLAAGPEHPLWTEEPADAGAATETVGAATTATGTVTTATDTTATAEATAITVLPSIGWLLASRPRDVVVRMANHGADHETFEPGGGPDPHYIKFGYSTHTAPGTGTAWRDGGVDGSFALLDPWRRWTRRRSIEARRTVEDVAYSEHVPHDRWGKELPDTRIVSASWFAEAQDALWEFRLHRVLGGAGWDEVREGGYAVAADRPPQVGTRHGGAWACTDAVDLGVLSAVLPLAGYGAAEHAAYQGSNALGEYSVTPLLTGRRGGRTDTVHVAGHLLRRTDSSRDGDRNGAGNGDGDAAAAPSLPTPPAVTVDGARVTLSLPGRVAKVIELAPWARE
jgi:hypothetical protein